ncbi:MFS transporter [Acidaminobacter hydrogenoformans]|uniref:Predicted arabinose efflux permease, MFS family n=1 Tax=Acidaminobacter hydrogenoformans DSM 2784 TaxID=1120920 RepID=A0A1G5S7G2_9FIRM|nr:MFS transporter [Acidaminobacter hydrogenoformans]SCZ81840.1 Predicted arabinose efflux permease, MFS family [Acidaminobacter hydrogenoformans DSM 2784]
MTRERLWTRDFITISTIFFLVALVFYLLMVTMASYAASAFNVSESMAGLVTGIFIIGALSGRILTSNLMVRIGSKRTLYLGLVLFTIGSGLYYFAVNIPLLLGIRFLHGMSTGITLNASATLVAFMIPLSRRAEGIGYFSTASVLSTALGPFLGIFMIQSAGLGVVFAFALAMSLVSLGLSFGIKTPRAPFLPVERGEDEAVAGLGTDSGECAQPRRGRVVSFLFDTFEPTALPIALVILLMAFAYSSILSFITLYAKAIDMVWAASLYFMVYAVAIILTRPFMGRAMDVRGANLVAYPALLAYIAGMALLSQAWHGMVLLLAAAIIGFGYGNFTSIAQTLAISRVPGPRISVATSTYFIFLELGLGAGPYILGTLIAGVGYRATYLSMTGVIFAAAVFYYLFYGRHEKKAVRRGER